MSTDAYKPPDARLTDRRSGEGRLYSPGQVAGAAFLGSPLAGCWLMARNYTELGNERARKLALIAGVLSTLGVIGLSLVLPDRFPNVVLPVAYTVAVHRLAKSLQGGQFDDHLGAGGQTHSWWRVVGVSFVCFVLFMAMATPFVLLMPDTALTR